MSNVLTIVIKGDAAQFTRTVRQVENGIARATGATKSFGHASVTSTQAASGAIRLLEGDITRNVRAVEKFLTTIPGVGTALKAAFPVVGALAFAGVIARVGEEVVKFVEDAQRMPQQISNAWREVTLSSHTANDELQKTNDKLENEIATLQGKPQNNLKIALDDARLAADALAKSLDEDNAKFADLLKSKAISFLSGLVSGNASTENIAGSINSYDQKLSDQGIRHQAAVDAYTLAVRQHGQKSPEAETAQQAVTSTLKDLHDTQDSLRKWLNDQIGTLSHPLVDPGRGKTVPGPNQQANLTILNSRLSLLSDSQTREQLENQNKTDQEKKDQLEAAKQAQEKLVQTWTEQLDKLKSLHDLTNADEANFWQARALTVQKGSIAYTKAIDSANKAMVPAVKALAEERDKYLANTTSGVPIIDRAGRVLYSGTFTNSKGEEQRGEAQFGGGENNLTTDSEMTRGITEQSKAISEWLRNLNEGPQIQKANADAMAEASLQIAVMTGQLSRHDAAVAQAQLHTVEYNHALEDLQNQLAALPNSGLSPDEQKAKATGIQNQIAILNGQRAVQEANDAQMERSTSALGELHDSVLHLADDFTDLGRQLSDLVTNTLNTLNQSLSDALMAHAYNGREYRRGITNALGNTARGAGSQILNDVFENLEGTALKKLIGKNPNEKKPKGTPDDPIYTRNAGDTQQGGGGILGGLLGKIMGKFLGGGGSILDLGSGGMGSLGQGSLPSIFGDGGPPSMDLSGMGDTGTSIPGFANGGDFFANRPMIVGERGPELVSFGSPGHVTPNHELFGGDTHLHIDARGSHDPAQTEAAIHRAMRQYLPHVAAAAAAANDERNARRPASARR